MTRVIIVTTTTTATTTIQIEKYEWMPGFCSLLKWNSTQFCELLGDRKVKTTILLILILIVISTTS